MITNEDKKQEVDEQQKSAVESTEEVVKTVGTSGTDVESPEESTTEAPESTKDAVKVESKEEVEKKPEQSSVDIPFIIGKKIGMTRIFDDSGVDYPVTMVEAGPCVVTQVKTVANDGYASVQLGFDNLKGSKSTKALQGHFKKSNLSVKRHLKECGFDSDVDFNPGDFVDVANFTVGELVAVTGVSKGRGFAGHMKRHGFGGGRRSHGKNSVMRKAGSIGAGSDPSKVWLGTRMAGRMGNDKVTVKNLQVVRVDLENNLLFVSGAIPGANNEIVYITK